MDATDDSHDREEFARLVRAELARRRMSRQQLAELARVSLSTLEKVLSGQRSLTLATRLRVGAALGLPIENMAAGPASPPPVAPVSLGAYSRSGVSDLEGTYLTLRSSFENAGAVYAYLTTISWDESRGVLVFAESARQDSAYAQQGEVSMPHQSGHIYLVTSKYGQYRVAILGRPTLAGALYGILTTLHARRGATLVPVATPIALVPLATFGEPRFGVVTPEASDYARYREHVARVLDDGFATIPGG